ncbi:MAG: tRNA (adenosine(37)-N6)-threonylcarbamoyltransferase complex dimerization subunit type 1 TsaB [Saprospiraceae bacterium]|nr:tRNA (adenosine(37)-N6)-threonylcarbamoyltransferase complex dimerization subunit type 1 TsaB [Saprospiraceae bacterium]
MAKILLIETATDVCSVAIANDGEVIALMESGQTASHSAVLTNFIAACTEKAGLHLTSLDAIAISGGPGSYSSLRVGASTAKGMAYALDKPLIAVDTLYSLAARVIARENGPFFVAPMLDARRNEVWTALYDHEGMQIAENQPLILDGNALTEWLTQMGVKPQDKVLLAGNGVLKVQENGYAYQAEDVRCSAVSMAAIADQYFREQKWVDTAYYEPFYMKPPNITTPKKQFLSD